MSERQRQRVNNGPAGRQSARNERTGDLTRVLVTGAGGVLGSELFAQLQDVDGLDVVGVTSRGRPEYGVAAWRMGAEPKPAALAGHWDVVVHCAASTRWSMTPAEAIEANIGPMLALDQVVDSDTHLIHVSTAYAGGRLGSIDSADVADYRNCYEWSKAASERMVRERFPSSTIYRPPLIIGRRRDGYASRFTGIYTFLRAASTGLAPALVAATRGRLEIVPVDDVASHAVTLVVGERPEETVVDVIGRGHRALTVAETLDVTQGALNEIRGSHGLPPIPRPPLIESKRWTRFYLPFASEHLTSRQLRTVRLLSEFEPYTSIEEPFEITTPVRDITPALRTAILHWAQRYPAAALGRPRAWSADAAS